METVKKIISLTREQYNTLVQDGTLTANGVTIDFNENDLYLTPQPAYYEQVDGVVMPSTAGTLATQEWVGANKPKLWQHEVTMDNLNEYGWSAELELVFICDSDTPFDLQPDKGIFVHTKNILLCYTPNLSDIDYKRVDYANLQLDNEYFDSNSQEVVNTNNPILGWLGFNKASVEINFRDISQTYEKPTLHDVVTEYKWGKTEE